MKLQKFIDILDQDSDTVIEFFKKNENDIFTNDKLLLALLNLKWSRKKRGKLICLAWMTPSALKDRSSEKKIYKVLPVYKYFHEYMYSCCKFFGDKLIPWEEWKDLAKEQVDLLKVLVKENKLEQFEEDKRYHDFCDKFNEREEKLFNKGYDQLRDGMYR